MPLVPRLLLAALWASAASPALAQHWVASWTGADQGPYPAGYPSAQPDLTFAFAHPEAGSHDQSFRMIIKPDYWGRQMRFRFSNVFGAKAVTFDTVFAGLQMSGAAVVAGTNRPVSFAGKPSVSVQPGEQVWSDAVSLPFVHSTDGAEIAGRRLAVTFHIPGDSGPMTWHATAMTTSYVTAPDAGGVGELEDDSAYPNSTTSWFFLDAADAAAPFYTRVVVCLGDSITDGSGSTLNGDDRWTDALSRRLHAEGAGVSVVNAGISGNQVGGPAEYNPAKPFAGGPSAAARLERDVLDQSGVTDVIVLEGINDLTVANAPPDAVMAGLHGLADRIRAKFKGVKLVGATLTSARGSPLPGVGSAEIDTRRHALNDMIRKAGLFDTVIDFDSVTVDPQTGELRPDFVPPSTAGGAGDKLHLNRAGYLAMGNAVDLRALAPAAVPRPVPKPVAKPASAGPNNSNAAYVPPT